jgi:hypothetical protein
LDHAAWSNVLPQPLAIRSKDFDVALHSEESKREIHTGETSADSLGNISLGDSPVSFVNRVKDLGAGRLSISFGRIFLREFSF